MEEVDPGPHIFFIPNLFKLPLFTCASPYFEAIPEEFSKGSCRECTNLTELLRKPDLLPNHLKWQQSNSESSAQMTAERERRKDQLSKCISCNMQPEQC